MEPEGYSNEIFCITHSCGHATEYRLGGTASERSRHIQWLSDMICPECRRDERMLRLAAALKRRGGQPFSSWDFATGKIK